MAFVKQGTTGTFYINGQLDNVIYSSKLVTYTKQDLCFGGDPRDSSGTAKRFDGTLKGFTIYRNALNSSAISVIYSQFQIPSAQPTTAPTSIPSPLPSRSPTGPPTTGDSGGG